MDMVDKDIRNEIRGSLIGGAVGDALGYPEAIFPPRSWSMSSIG